ncbi:MAG: Coq4 family protein [Bacteroidota bacterium]
MRKLKNTPTRRDRLMIWLVDRTKPLYVRWFKGHRQHWRLDRRRLLGYPAKSLGYELGKFLEREGFELLPKLEDHDVLHVLLHYETTVIGEVQMQAFLLGNGKRSLYAAGTVLLALLLIPEGYRRYWAAYRRGWRSRSITGWRFEHLLREPTVLLRQLMGILAKDEGVEAPLVL